MSRLINTSDLHEKVILNKPEWGIFQNTIDHIIEGVVSQVPTTSGFTKKQVIKMLEELQEEAEHHKKFTQDLREPKKDNERLEAYYTGQIQAYGIMAVRIMRRIEALKAD